MSGKVRLDQRLCQEYAELTRNQIQTYIAQGLVTVNGVVEHRGGRLIDINAPVTLTLPTTEYVSRAGEKLFAALEAFGINVMGKVILDAGISTGGFTDCLLQRGAQRVYGVDVGHGQVHKKIATDARVVLMEKVNLRAVTALPEPIDMVTLDLSFISLLKVIEIVKKLLKVGGELVVLIKPQFEGTPADVGKGGIVRNEAVRECITRTVVAGIVAVGFKHEGTIPSPIKGSSGNQEFLAYFVAEK